MKLTTFILIDPNDDTGNDDGILDEMDMSAEEAQEFNEIRYAKGSDCRWVEKFPKKSLGITHLD